MHLRSVSWHKWWNMIIFLICYIYILLCARLCFSCFKRYKRSFVLINILVSHVVGKFTEKIYTNDCWITVELDGKGIVKKILSCLSCVMCNNGDRAKSPQGPDTPEHGWVLLYQGCKLYYLSNLPWVLWIIELYCELFGHLLVCSDTRSFVRTDERTDRNSPSVL